jgi:hypothetical protein
MSDIKVRVGQQNAIKIVSSISGSSGGQAYSAENVVGGIGSVRELYVSGISTFVGVSTFKNDVYINGTVTIDGDLTIGDDLKFDSFVAREGYITGIATVNNLNIIGVSTFVGVSTFKNNVYVDGDVFVTDDLTIDELLARNAIISGIATISDGLYYEPYLEYGMAYFNPSGLMVSTASPEGGIDYTNYIMTTDNARVPTWSNAIDGGFY